MTSVPSSESASQSSGARNTLVLVVYTAAIFTSALLLFSVQPLFTKMVLPRLGGSPAVWSVAMVFFQSLLLGGYAYAHYLMTIKSRDRSGGDSSCGAGRGAADAAAVDRKRVGEPPAAVMRSGCWACSRSRSACRFLRSPPTIRCCRHGLSAPAIPTDPIPISSMRRRTSAAFCAAVLSGSAGADVHAADPEPDLDLRLWIADRVDRGLRHLAAAFAADDGSCGREPATAMRLRRHGPRGCAGSSSPPFRPGC